MKNILKNEQDVREEVATPFLKALGYESGTSNNIERERRLRYSALQLGRKKPNDAPLPLGGHADYLLTVAGVGRWVLETKPPCQEITIDDIDQVTSYARHPEVSGYYAALLNGHRFVLFHSTQTSNDMPLVNLSVTSPNELASKLEGILTPAAFGRDCRTPAVDLREPLALGYRGEAEIVGGWNKHLAIDVDFVPSNPAVTAVLKGQYAKIVGMQSTVRGGRIWRDQASRIRARVAWHPPHEKQKPFLDAVGLDQFEYVCLGNRISADPTQPTAFEILSSFEIREGQVCYDLLQWKTQVMGFDAAVTWQGQATGYLDGTDFVGVADFRSTTKINAQRILMVMHFVTQFSFTTRP